MMFSNFCGLKRIATLSLIHAAFSGALFAQSSNELGEIDFETSGKSTALASFNRGLLALHSFWFPEAIRNFKEAEQRDPQFVMAYWGQAFSYHWSLQGIEQIDSARAVLAHIDKLLASGAPATPRERAYIEALRALFGSGSSGQRRQSYAAAMNKLAAAFPNDVDAKVFAALAELDAQSSASDSTIIRIARPVETLFEQQPRHPGAAHLLIHAYDRPTLASRGLSAAQTYDRIAPASAHAVHMPSHIYAQLEMWQQVANSNRRAYDISAAWVERAHLSVTERDYHALQWLHRAYMKLGRIDLADQVIADHEKLLAQHPEAADDLKFTLGILKFQKAHGGDATLTSRPN